MAGRLNNNISHNCMEGLVDELSKYEYTTDRITVIIYANVTPSQIGEIRRTHGDLTIGDKGPRNAIAIQGYRDQLLEDRGRLLNAFRKYDPNAERQIP